MRGLKEGERLGVQFALSEKLTKAVQRKEDIILKMLTLQATEAARRLAEKEGIDLYCEDWEMVLKSIRPSFCGKFYEVRFELVRKKL